MTIGHNQGQTDTFDLIVIGGGINGAGVARDAAGRGHRVLLVEQDDLAAHTSSASTKLIHGGLRYLEHYDFALVRHALEEREVLLRLAPHIIWPLRFVLPHHRALRPRWLIRLGLFLYDHLGGRKLLPGSHSLKLGQHVSGAALKPEFTHGFEYSDCWVQDSRLVVLNAMDARENGAEVLTRTRCINLTRHSDYWEVELRDMQSGEISHHRARAVVNASGPWVDRTLDMDESNDATHSVRLVKGSHIVVPKLFDHEYTYIFQNSDNRVLFAVPYEQHYTLLGTTDIEIDGDPADIKIEQQEIDYICKAVSEYFQQPVKPASVVWTYSGVRPLYDDDASNASKVTRDYKLHMDTDQATVLSIYGGKITTYRKLAEEVVDLLQGELQNQGTAWTADKPLPGGDIADADFDGFLQQCRAEFGWLPESLLHDYARNYGTRINQLLGECTDMESLGRHFGGDLYQREVNYLQDNEWAITAEDIIWRRSKKGLAMTADEITALQTWLDKQAGERDLMQHAS